MLASSVTSFAAGENNGCIACGQNRDAGCFVTDPPAALAADPVKRHPLRGVITAVLAEKSALMVRHEQIPGVMRAMTMMFKVEPQTLPSVRQGDAITAQMSREGDDWWLRDVKVVPAPAGKQPGVD